jgi:hypothetical protein
MRRKEITKFWKAVDLLSSIKTASNPTYIRNGYFLNKNWGAAITPVCLVFPLKKSRFIIYKWTWKTNEKIALDNMHCQSFESVSFRVQDRCSVTESACFLFTSVQVINTIGFELLCWPPLWSSGQNSWLQNGDVLCFLWGMNWIYICFETRWGEFLNLPNPSGRIMPWGSLSL